MNKACAMVTYEVLLERLQLPFEGIAKVIDVPGKEMLLVIVEDKSLPAHMPGQKMPQLIARVIKFMGYQLCRWRVVSGESEGQRDA